MSQQHQLRLEVLPGLFAISRLEKDAAIPPWASSGVFYSITRTADEFSVVCPQQFVPAGIRCERGWRCLRVGGTMDFSMIGVVSSLVRPLAETGIGVFVVSTFDTDYLLLKDADLESGITALGRGGHIVNKRA
jgi:hypothetical protein